MLTHLALQILIILNLIIHNTWGIILSDKENSNSVNRNAKKHTICIIGAGVSGFRFFAESIHLTLRDRLEDSIRYVFIDERDFVDFGRGVAWTADQSDALRANMHAHNIVIDRHDRDRLTRHLGFKEGEEITDGTLFTKRSAIGDIISHSFQETWNLAQDNNIETHAVKGKAIRVLKAGVGYDIEIENGPNVFANTLVFALGHIPPTNYPHLFDAPNYFRSAWDWNSLQKIAPDTSVALLGLGPTAVDSVIVLREAGLEKICGYSRSGLMQYPRSRPKNCDLSVISEEKLIEAADALGGFRTDAIISLALTEFLQAGIDWKPMRNSILASMQPPTMSLRHGLAQSREVSDWYGLLLELDDVVPIMWHNLLDSEREKFKEIRKIYSNVCYGMASPQAIRILHEIENGHFFPSSHLVSVEYRENSKKFIVTTKKDGQNLLEEFDVVIDCSGFGTDLSLSRTPLIKNLLDDGVIEKHPHGGCKCDFYTGQVFDQDSNPTGQIYCLVGSLSIGTRLVTNGIGECARSAVRTAEAIHNRIAN